jgi:hypothetical protein
VPRAAVGAQVVEWMLIDAPAAVVERFHRRGRNSAHDPWHAQVRAIFEQLGGDDLLGRSYTGLQALINRSSTIIPITSVEDQIDDTYQAFVECVG